LRAGRLLEQWTRFWQPTPVHALCLKHREWPKPSGTSDLTKSLSGQIPERVLGAIPGRRVASASRGRRIRPALPGHWRAANAAGFARSALRLDVQAEACDRTPKSTAKMQAPRARRSVGAMGER